jgi:PilZ domain
VTLNYTDRRKHQRIEVVKAIFIEVVNRKGRGESDNTIIRCETVDVSVSGLRIYVTQAIAKGSTLNIAVPMEDWKENLELVGEAVWVKPLETGEGFWVGLELRDSNLENMRKWFKVVHTLSNTPSGGNG